jgi:hypothetical protein
LRESTYRLVDETDPVVSAVELGFSPVDDREAEGSAVELDQYDSVAEAV